MSASATGTAGADAIRPRKIGILGFGPTLNEAPFADPSWELWGMNGLHRILPKGVREDRFSLWFELHTQAFLEWHGPASNIGRQQLDWLEKPHPFPILHHEQRADWPMSERFDIDRCIAVGRDYFTSSVAYEIAWALVEVRRAMQGDEADARPLVEEVGVWGIDLVHGTEWEDQRPCAEYWLGLLEGHGIKVHIPEGSALFKTPFRYGYDEVNPLYLEVMGILDKLDENVTKGIADCQKRIDADTRRMHSNDGAHQAANEIREALKKHLRGARLI
jgi:hypothetical protein